MYDMGRPAGAGRPVENMANDAADGFSGAGVRALIEY
jgi:hypothetical protein